MVNSFATNSELPGGRVIHLNRELNELFTDLHRQVSWRGLVRSGLGLVALLTLAIVTVTRADVPSLLFMGCLTGLVYASVFVTTHDALHHTLSGIGLVDEIVPRLISYPALWFHGTYKELHLIHHRTNGHDLTDPERPQYSTNEYTAASSVKRWYIRNQWFADLFLFAGFGFIGHHVAQGLVWSKKVPRVRRALYSDLLGIIVMNGVILTATSAYGVTKKYLFLYLCLERISGLVHQFRSKVEHYGLWGKEALPLETQIYASRNIITSRWASFYLNGLNFHSIHHAFPRVPYYHLKTADARLRAWANKRNRPMPTSECYLKTAWALATRPQLIDASMTTRPASRPLSGFEFGVQR